MMRRVAIASVAVMMMRLAPQALDAQAKATDPFAAYQEYLVAHAKASSLEDLFPYYTKELSDGLRKMPKEMQGNYLKMNRREVKDPKVTKQNVTANKAELAMTGKDSVGQDLIGTATLVREGGGWRIDDFAWVGAPLKL